MNPIKAVTTGIAAIKQGNILRHPEFAKKLHIAIFNVTAVALAVHEFTCSLDEMCYGFTTSLATRVGFLFGCLAFIIYHTWSVLATSKKVGWGKAIDQELAELPNDFSFNDPATTSPELQPTEDRHTNRLNISNELHDKTSEHRGGPAANSITNRSKQEPPNQFL